MITFNDPVDEQGLVQDLRFITGQDSLHINDATRLLNFGLNAYSRLAISSGGRWKFHDTRHENSDGDKTLPRATAILASGKYKIPLNTEYLALNQVAILVDGKYKVLDPVDVRDRKGVVMGQETGVPESYDYDAHSIYFDKVASGSFTIRILFTMAARHFEVSDTDVELGIPTIDTEYIVNKAAFRLALKTNDPNRVALRDEITKQEKEIKDFLSVRDEDTPQRIKGKVPSAFMRARK